MLEMDGQFDKLEELIYVESHLSNTSAKFYGEITQQMLKNSSFPGSNNGTGLLQVRVDCWRAGGAWEAAFETGTVVCGEELWGKWGCWVQWLVSWKEPATRPHPLNPTILSPPAAGPARPQQRSMRRLPTNVLAVCLPHAWSAPPFHPADCQHTH